VLVLVDGRFAWRPPEPIMIEARGPVDAPHAQPPLVFCL